VRRHDLDWTSLLAGLVITVVGVAYLVGAYTTVRVDSRWLLPLALVGIGLAGLAGSISAVRRSRPAEAAALETEVPAAD
jgi:hypothetical protein